jgi:hypothetical protein
VPIKLIDLKQIKHTETEQLLAKTGSGVFKDYREIRNLEE